MGAANVSDAMIWSARAALALVPSVLCAPASAQSTLPRDFERVHFARREAELDRMFTGAGIRLRNESARKLRRAAELRGWADSLAGTRGLRLAAAWAKLAGFEDGDVASAQRLDWFLLALPEIVDTEKLEKDRVRLGEITRSIYPLLRPVVVQDPEAPAPDRDFIHMTGRTVFGFAKPPKLRLRMQVEKGGGIVVAQRERGDSEDPRGWMLYDLVSKIPLDEDSPVGGLTARLLVGRNGSWPRVSDPTCEARFWHAPGFHRRAWELFDRSRALIGQRRIVDWASRSVDWARLSVLQDEVLRPLLGRDYIHRSWPVQALEEAHELVAALEAHNAKLLEGREEGSKVIAPITEPPEAVVEALPDVGDRSFGVVAGEGDLRQVLPLRVVWGSRSKSIQKRVLFILPPGGHDENWVLDGLRFAPSKIQSVPGLIVAFAHEPLRKGYIPAAKALLRELFGVETTNMTLAGFLDGGTRARFAYPSFGGRLAEVAFLGHELPDARILGDTVRVERVRLISAYGYPSSVQAKRLRQLPNYDSHKARLRVALTRERPRSLTEAFELLVKSVIDER